MPIELNATHDPAATSWVAGTAGDTDFPIQNLPFGIFRTGDDARGGIALGERIVDLRALAATGALEGAALEAARAASGATLAPLLACPPAAVSALRAAVFELFREGGDGDRALLEPVLVPMADAESLMPLKPPAFTDFCTSFDHISRMGGGGMPKLAALSLPVAYNGRASSVRASGAPVIRPMGQFELPGSNAVTWGPEPLLDFELEFGAWLRADTVLGEPIGVAAAEDLLFGCCLVNDWSARGIQFFEMILGPHLGKSFLTTVSPWIVTMEALAPFRVPARGRPEGEPAVPGYLDDADDRAHGAIAITLIADLEVPGGARKRIVETELGDLYWTLAQMAAHQASNGAPLEAGDLIATGTVSGAVDTARACFAEITERGTRPIALPDGTTRTMFDDGDTLVIRGRTHAEGYRPIGFGDCTGTIHPAKVPA